MKFLYLLLGFVCVSSTNAQTFISLTHGDTRLGDQGSNLITNGSFEGHVLFDQWAQGTPPTGWTSSGSAANYAYYTDPSWGKPYSFIADGNNSLYFGNSQTIAAPIPTLDYNTGLAGSSSYFPNYGLPVEVSQTISGLDPAGIYMIDFYASHERSSGSPSHPDGAFRTTIGANSFDLICPNEGAFGTSERYQFRFIPNSGSINLSFTNFGHIDMGGGVFAVELVLDDVIMNRLYTVSGSVWDDIDASGSIAPNGGETYTTLPTLYAKIIKGGVVIGVKAFSSGNYSFTEGFAPGAYSVIIDDNDSPSDVSPTLPLGWINTSASGLSRSFSIVNANITDQNFSLQQPPVAVNVTHNPALTNDLSATNITLLDVSDPSVGGSVVSYRISNIPPLSQGILLINGAPVAEGVDYSPVDMATLQFDPNASYTGIVNFNFTGTDNGTAISNVALYTLTVIAPLPLSLLSFTGTKEGQGNRLRWVTTQEVNVSHFVVEKANDNGEYAPIAKFYATNTGGITTYTYYDPLASENNYYRLVMYDLDGSFHYSNIIEVENNNFQYLLLYPNPAHEFATILGINGTEVQITDVNGKVVYKAFIEQEKLVINLSEWQKGIYFVSYIIKPGKTTTLKLSIE